MKTVVFQSFRTERVPGWVAACMRSAREWARRQGFEYTFIDDAFLELAPPWYRERCSGEICPVADLARLVMAKQLLAQGYDRTVWIDADVLVFAPETLNVDVNSFAFCLQFWPGVTAGGELSVGRHINNCICVFTRESRHLDFFIDSCLRIAGEKQRVGKLDISTAFLTGLHRLMPLPALANVGIFSPALIIDMVRGNQRFVIPYAAVLPAPLAAANLCNSLVGKPDGQLTATDADCEALVEQLLGSRGEFINRHVKPAMAAG